MFGFLKNHPFAVEAFFDSSIVLTFAVPKCELVNLIPACVELDTFHDEFAFIAVAMVQTRNLRPKGFPEMIGNDFFLIGYRVFVKYFTNSGKRLRGLYILKSETNKKKMELFGNIFTHYNYSTTDITVNRAESTTQIISEKSGLQINIRTGIETIPLPENSPFANWNEARRYAGPLPFTFTYQSPKKEVLIIEGVREHWEPRPVKVINYHFSFLDSLELKNIRLANAFIINNIPYHWKKGKTEKWKQ